MGFEWDARLLDEPITTGTYSTNVFPREIEHSSKKPGEIYWVYSSWRYLFSWEYSEYATSCCQVSSSSCEQR